MAMRSSLAQPQIVTQNGKPVSVIVPIAEYEELLERAEDAADIAWLRRARRKPMQYRSLDEYLAARQT
jgi:antitoxin (DNA-binding transcriptional repressor) of toxin-antitoxin stability system